MKIKTKLNLGIGLLFLLIIILTVIGIININALKNDSENILTANQNTLVYTREMLSALDDTSRNSLQIFESNLKKQEKNITEIGENEITLKLRMNFESLKVNHAENEASVEIRKNIFQIMKMNMEAIQRKSEIAKATADSAVLWIAISGSLCFLISLTLLINLPSTIANPIRELTESIKQIAAKNYSKRVKISGPKEFIQLAMSFNTMAKKLEEYNNSNLAKLMIEKKRIETLINKMNDPVIGLDENLKIIFANEEAIKISGLKNDTLIGELAHELAHENDLIRNLILDIKTHQVDNNESKKTIKIFASNKESYFEKETLHISIIPTGEETQQIIGYVIFLRNITRFKELDFAKTNFIATISHEFKTPISSIKMSIQLLENPQIGALNSEQNNLINSIKEDTNRLLKFTGELLNMTQAETGNIQLSIVPSDPREILSYAIDATRKQAEQKQIQLVIHCEENIPNMLADAEKTAWVLTNLIANAIRYSYDNASVQIKISQKNKSVDIAVIDTGQGIQAEYKDKIFDRYFRVPGTQKEGTGLGLAISKEFIEAQNGTIHVESEYGKGSTFTITLNQA